MVQNAEWLLTKNRIISKVYEMFGSLADEYRATIVNKRGLAEDVLKPAPKIFKGENYQGLPYVMLDYPRSFGKEDTFAVRTMFWWGHYFSITLHLKGKHKREFLPRLSGSIQLLSHHNFYIGIDENEWEHEINPANFELITNQSDNVERLLHAHEFCKIAGKLDLSQWHLAHAHLLSLYEVLFHQVLFSSRGDEKGL